MQYKDKCLKVITMTMLTHFIESLFTNFLIICGNGRYKDNRETRIVCANKTIRLNQNVRDLSCFFEKEEV